jgi:predicted NBD/HSP70 family sugar kinase
MSHLWGIDLGGTKIEGVVLDPSAPDKPISRLRVHTESEKGYEHICGQIALVCKMMAEKTGLPLPERIGMGTPGVLVNGQVLPGCHGIAGEWGQLILDPNGTVSNYGTRGTVESIIAGPSLERFYAEQSGERRPLKEITERAKLGTDQHAVQTMSRLTDYFAQAIGTIIDVLDPHAIVLGGGVGNIDVLYTEEMRKKITAVIFNPTFEAALLKPSLGDSAGVFGAAMLVV